MNRIVLDRFRFLDGDSIGSGGVSGNPIHDRRALDVVNSSAYLWPAFSLAFRINASQRRRSIDFIWWNDDCGRSRNGTKLESRTPLPNAFSLIIAFFTFWIPLNSSTFPCWNNIEFLWSHMENTNIHNWVDSPIAHFRPDRRKPRSLK